jgi:hypothetical protein
VLAGVIGLVEGVCGGGEGSHKEEKTTGRTWAGEGAVHSGIVMYTVLMSRKQDFWIFGLGASFTLFCFWAIWHYLG